MVCGGLSYSHTPFHTSMNCMYHIKIVAAKHCTLKKNYVVRLTNFP